LLRGVYPESYVEILRFAQNDRRRRARNDKERRREFTMDFTLPEELKMVQSTVRKFVKEELIPLEREILGREGEPESGRVILPPEIEDRLVKMVQDMELWGLNVPEEWGGVGLGTLGCSVVEEELAKTIVPFDFGNITPILFECNEQQREQYLLPVISRHKRYCLALLEPKGGFEPQTMQTIASRVNSDYIINGYKVSPSIDAGDFAIVFAVTDREKEPREGISCFLVDRDTPGLTVLGEEEKRGWRAQVIQPKQLVFHDCHVPAGDMLGAEGKAFHLGKQWLPSRRIVKGAKCVGVGRRILNVSAEYANQWEAFGQLIKVQLNVKRALADMAIDIEATRLMMYQAAWKADEGQDVRYDSAMVKVLATEMVRRCADRAVLIHGGPGYTGELLVKRLAQNAVAAAAVEDSLELQKDIIARELLKAPTLF
jgi:alkylation response protein AidB-like acyl-CoA dehydrogenase